jgi:glutaredoxin-like protein
MAQLKDADRKKVSEILAGLENDVRILMFTQETECQYCGMTRELVEEIAALSDRLTTEIRDFVADAELAKGYGVDKIPALVLLGDRDYGIRFYGVPAGYEFSALLDAIVDVGRRDAALAPELLAELAKIDQPVHLQVLVTPT